MKLSLSGIGAEIQRILYDYVQAESITNSPGEREAEVIEALRAAGAEDPEAVALFRRGDTIVSAAAQ